MLAKLLAKFGYYKINWGYSCGRHWIEINGKTIAQTPRDDWSLDDQDIRALVYICLGEGKKPDKVAKREAYWAKMDSICRHCGHVFKEHRASFLYGNESEFVGTRYENLKPHCPKLVEDGKFLRHDGWHEQVFEAK